MTATDYIVELCRLYVLVALLFAAWGKSAGFAAFRASLGDSFPAIVRVDGAVAFAIIAAEWIIVVSMLTGGALARIGIAAACLLFLLFTVVIGWALVSGRAIVCSCFGASGHRIGNVDLVRNIALTSAAGVAAVWSSTEIMIVPIERLILIGIATIFVLASVWLRDLLWLLRAKPGS